MSNLHPAFDPEIASLASAEAIFAAETCGVVILDKRLELLQNQIFDVQEDIRTLGALVVRLISIVGDEEVPAGQEPEPSIDCGT